jgi:hypothetical protein
MMIKKVKQIIEEMDYQFTMFIGYVLERIFVRRK